MALPIVVQYNLAAALTTGIVNAAAATAAALALVTTIVDANQRRLLLTMTGNESSNTFVVNGTNGAGFPITDRVSGVNNSTTNSNLDFKTVSSIKPLAATVGTTSVGTYEVGSSLWNIMNWNASPVNIEIGTILQTGAATWSVQYTYDDPNNLPPNVSVPTAFNHATIVNQTATIDGAINDPVTAIRLQVTGGTGTVRMTIIQAGLGSP